MYSCTLFDTSKQWWLCCTPLPRHLPSRQSKKIQWNMKTMYGIWAQQVTCMKIVKSFHQKYLPKQILPGRHVNRDNFTKSPEKKLLLCSLLYLLPKYANFLMTQKYLPYLRHSAGLIMHRKCNDYKHAVTHFWVNIVEETSLKFPEHLTDKVYHDDCHCLSLKLSSSSWLSHINNSTCSALIYLYNLSSVSVRPFRTTWNNQFSILEL